MVLKEQDVLLSGKKDKPLVFFMEDYTSQKIAQNTLYLTLAYIFQKIISFFYFIFIARTIGAESLGKYSFALSFSFLLGIIIDFGLSPVLTRETAKFKEKAQNFLANVFSLKIIGSFLIYGILFLTINLLNYPSSTKILVYLAGIAMILDSFSLSFYAFLRAFQNLKYESLGIIGGHILMISLGSLALFFRWPLWVLILAVIFNSFFNFLLSLGALVKRYHLLPFFVFQKKGIIFLLKTAFPFALAGIFTRIYGYIDQVLLSYFAGDHALGIYSVSYKLTFALQFIPLAFMASIFPAMSFYYQRDQTKLGFLLEKSFRYLIFISLPIVLGTVILGKEIIFLLYGKEFLASAIVLKILVLSLFFIFLNFPLGALLNACDRQTINTINIGLATLLNIILNLVLIPLYSFKGAALAALISSLFLFLLGLFWVPKIIRNYSFSPLFKLFFKNFLAAFLMGGFIYLFEKYFHLIILIILGGIFYFFLSLLFKNINFRDLAFLKSLFLRKKEI